MTPDDLALDLAVDKALGKEHRASYFCRICKAVFEPIRMNWARGMCPVCSSWSAPDKTKAVASRAWSTSPEAVGEMMQWLAEELESQPTTDDLTVEYECGEWDVFSLYRDSIGSADTLPHALALAVVEVAKRKEALKP